LIVCGEQAVAGQSCDTSGAQTQEVTSAKQSIVSDGFEFDFFTHGEPRIVVV
jgi:hypothetical protein